LSKGFDGLSQLGLSSLSLSKGHPVGFDGLSQLGLSSLSLSKGHPTRSASCPVKA
jgi:hypothetical protein